MTTASPTVGRIRWVVVILVMLIAAVSYLDRSNISIAAPVLKHDLGLSDLQLGTVFSAFVLGYALAQPFAGRLADRLGAYPVIAGGIIWWSVLTAAMAMTPSGTATAFAAVIIVRLLLGIGESVIFPASNRIVANWIPTTERGLANGLIFAGVGVGAGIAPPLITSLMLAHDWRWAFWVSAAIGVVACVLWLVLARERPERHYLVRSNELALINEGLPATDAAAPTSILRWRDILRQRSILLLSLSYFCFGYVAYIFFTWFFSYLSTVRGLDLKSSGIYGTLPFIAMAIASPVGGYISDRLTRRYDSRRGRCIPAALAMICAALFVALATQVADARLASLVLALGSGSLYFAQSAYWTLSADLGRESAGSVSGVMNMACQLGGVAVAQLTPLFAASLGWTGSFLIASVVALLGAVTWFFIDPKAVIARGNAQ